MGFGYIGYTIGLIITGFFIYKLNKGIYFVLTFLILSTIV